MKLYMHPVSNTSRPVRMFIDDNNLPVEEEVIDLMTGAHHQEPYISLNPNRQVPTLVDGDLTLGESSTILKYLAEKFDLAAYPKDLKKRAKVNELMDWFNTHFYHDYAYGVVYPQIFPHHKRPSDELQKGTIAWAQGAHQEVAAGPERPLARQGQQIPDRRPDHDRRLFRRGAADLRRLDPHRVQGLSEHRRLAEADGRDAELGEVQRSALGLSRLSEGTAVRDDLSCARTLSPCGERVRCDYLSSLPGLTRQSIP